MMSRSTAISCCILALLGLAPSVGWAADRGKETLDTLASVCQADGAPAEICGCAAAEFRRAADKSDVAIYADVGRIYLTRLKAARPQMEAWDDAIGTVAIKKRILPADLADKTSVLRVRYKDTIRQCEEATASIPAADEQKSP